MGFSWGTVLGLWTAHDYPDDFLAFISVSQVVDYQNGEKISLAYVQKVADDTHNQTAMQELANINPAYQSSDWYDQLMWERKWLLTFGGVYHSTNSYMHEVWMLLKAREYSFIDFCFWPISSNKSLQTMYPELMQINFFESVPRVDVPVYFLVGQYDYNAPSELTRAYFEGLQAPQGKQLIWFDDSAHDLFFDQPRAVVNELVKIKGQ
jgi:pimeloyl-ACP methyl ester carboxylesterase